MSLFWIYICIEENNNRQSGSPRWNTSVILFMHLSLLALLPCVLSLGGPACCAPESWHAQAEGRGSSGGKDRQLYEYPDRASAEHMQWSFSQRSFSRAPAWPSGAARWAGGWEISLKKNHLNKAASVVRPAWTGMRWLKSADGYIPLLLSL